MIQSRKYIEQQDMPQHSQGGNKFLTDLPSLVTANDVREVVRYLRRTPEGIPPTETNEAFRRRILDSRKLAAYEAWGIVTQKGNRILLGDLGRDFAGRLSSEIEVYREILRRTKAYQSALEWIDLSDLELLTCEELAEFWERNLADSDDENMTEGHVVTFFDLCHAAELGYTTAGRKGHPARLRIHRLELSNFLTIQTNEPLIELRIGTSQVSAHTESKGKPGIVLFPEPKKRSQAPVLVLQHRNVLFSVKLKTALETVGLESIFVERDDSPGSEVWRRELDAMRQCGSGVIVITHVDCSDDLNVDTNLAENVVFEVGAAVAHFNKRVVLLIQKGVRLPGSFRRLNCCEFDGGLPGWDVLSEAAKIVKALNALNEDTRMV